MLFSVYGQTMAGQDGPSCSVGESVDWGLVGLSLTWVPYLEDGHYGSQNSYDGYDEVEHQKSNSTARATRWLQRNGIRRWPAEQVQWSRVRW